jgi:hypothetical protein
VKKWTNSHSSRRGSHILRLATANHKLFMLKETLADNRNVMRILGAALV